jgi:hypothetical protein
LRFREGLNLPFPNLRNAPAASRACRTCR